MMKWPAVAVLRMCRIEPILPENGVDRVTNPLEMAPIKTVQPMFSVSLQVTGNGQTHLIPAE
jgi:hypothetical protein